MACRVSQKQIWIFVEPLAKQIIDCAKGPIFKRHVMIYEKDRFSFSVGTPAQNLGYHGVMWEIFGFYFLRVYQKWIELSNQ